MEFWLDMGVDGLRLDAVPYLYEREGTNCENLPETHEFLKQAARAHRRPLPRTGCSSPRPTSGPRTPSSTSATATNATWRSISRSCRGCSWRSGWRTGSRSPTSSAQTPPIPDTAQWALFLRNHDELTLEMVTDEERDYMYRVYANDPQMRINLGIRRRLAPLLNNNRRRIELMNGLLMSLPGTPVLYYGDEIGMGDNVYLGDRNGVRTPMQWSGDRNAGFSEANRQALYFPVITDPEYHFEAINVQAQQSQPAVAAVVDETADRAAPPAPGVRARIARVPAPGEPQGPGVHPAKPGATSRSSSSPTSRGSRSRASSTCLARGRHDAGRDVRAGRSSRRSGSCPTS